MKKNILLFYCFLAMMAASLKAQEIRPMPADSAYGVVHISVCNLREEGKLYRMGAPDGNYPHVERTV